MGKQKPQPLSNRTWSNIWHNSIWRYRFVLLFLSLLLMVSFSACSGRIGSNGPLEGVDENYSEGLIEEISEDEIGETQETEDTGQGDDKSSTSGEAQGALQDNKDGRSANGIEEEKISQTGETSGKNFCTYSINCSTIFDNLDKIDEAVLGLQPEDGWIFSPKEIEFKEGESVFDILLRLTREEKIHMEFNSNPALNSKYIEGVNNLYEFDVGELSGWTYKINGKGMGYGSSSSYPKDGDVIEWVYTCDQGRDVGVEP